MEKEFKAVVVSISDEARTKSNGKEYMLATVKFTSGVLAGTEYFAQRTLGSGKAAIKVGQQVICHLSVVNNRPFFEIASGGSVTPVEQLQKLLGL